MIRIVEKIEQAKQQVTSLSGVAPNAVNITLPLYMQLLLEVEKEYVDEIAGMSVTVFYHPGHVFMCFNSDYQFGQELVDDEPRWRQLPFYPDWNI